MFIQGIKKTLIFSLLISLFIAPPFVFSQEKKLVINEILPAPKSQPYEWVEVVNTGTAKIYSSEIEIKDTAGNKLTLNFTSLEPNEYGVATASSVLNNSGDTITITLKTTGEELAREIYSTIDYDLSWARCPNLTGSFIQNSNPTEGQENICPTPTPSPTPSPTASPTPTLPPQNFILELSEVYPNPFSSENEWVEIYNPNEFEVKAINWQIDDKEGAGKPVSFSAKIPAKGYLAITLTKAIFNNSGDEVRLLNPEGKVVDQFTYSFSQKGLAWAKDSSQNWCLQEPTKEKTNPKCPDNTSANSSNEEELDLKQTSSLTNLKREKLNNENTPVYFNTYQPTSVLGVYSSNSPSPPSLSNLKNQVKRLQLAYFAFQFNLITLLYFFFKLLKLL